MIGTLGQFVREIRDLLLGSGDPIPVEVNGVSLDFPVGGIEINNDSGNPIPVITGIQIPEHDYIELLYNPSNLLSEITYKTGGLSGTTVATLQLAYDGLGNLISVTRV